MVAHRISWPVYDVKAFRALAAHASRPKRIAVPLLLLAAKGWTLPARLFFQKLYYPLVERRTAQ